MSETSAPVLVPQTPSTVPPQLPASSSSAPPMYKNKLQEYSQRSSLPLPMYSFFNEGTVNASKFRATVCVAGESYSSENTFSKQKAAEQDAARVALERIFEKKKSVKLPIVHVDLLYCKSILHEFIAKMRLTNTNPTYDTVRVREKPPLFRSSVIFNGVTYTGECAQNKKDAEKLAARAVILSLLGNPAYQISLTEIIHSKAKIYYTPSQEKDSCNAGNSSQLTGVEVATNQVENPLVTHQASTDSTADARPLKQLSSHEFILPRAEQLPNQMRLPISFVTPVVEQPLGVKDSCDCGNSSQPAELKLTIDQAKHARVTDQMSVDATAEAQPLQQLPCNEFSLPGPEHLSDKKGLPNSFVISVSGNPLGLKDPHSGENGSHSTGVKVTSEQVGNNVVTHHASTVTTEACLDTKLSCHDLSFSRSGQFSDAMELPIPFVTPASDQQLGVAENNKRKRKKNKRKANKKLHSDVLPSGGVPLNEQ